MVDELGGKTTYTYDALDNIAKVTDALRQVTSYTYDKNGSLTSETDALGNRVQYSYTPEGWLSSITKADGTVLTFEYDKTGSLLTQNVGDGQTIYSGYNELGMVTEVSSAEGTIVYQYNGQGYLISVTNVNGDVVSYAYDDYGNKTSMTYPDGRAVSYTYDSMNRMTSVTGLNGDVTRYTYDAAGRRIETASSTLTTAYSYDSVGNLLEQVTSGASDIAFSYSYNKNGYITGEVRTENGQTTENTYAYDALGQLTNFLQSTGYGESYTYDKAGNMTGKVISGMDRESVALSMSYNKGNQLTAMANGKNKITYFYDKNGSMVQKVLSSQTYGKLTDTYAYNALDQLTSYTSYDGYTQQFTYDANGMRLSKSEAGDANRSTLEELLRGNIAGLPEIVEPAQSQTNADKAGVPEELEWATTEYLYDLTQEYYQIISETTTSAGGASSTTAYAYGLERIAAYTSDSRTGYIYDGRGSVAHAISVPVAGEAVSSALPDVSVQVHSFSYTAFGEQMGSVKVSGFSYNAEAYDAATGMLNLRARQYEPALGRFSQKDIVRGQVRSPLSLNRYAYCANSSLTFVDPNGMLFEKLISTAKSIVKTVVETTKKAVKTAAAYVKTVVQKKMIDDAQLFGEYSSNYLSLDSEKQCIIRDAVYKLHQIDLSTAKGRIEASIIFSNACSLLKGESGGNSAGAVQTPEPTPAPTPTPTPTPTPASQQPLPQTTYPDGYSFMVNGYNLAQQLRQYLIPKYDQSAKEYNKLTGTNTFVLIEKEPTGVEQFISTVYNNSLRPIGQMLVEDWNASLAASKARYIAFKTDGSPYNTANFFLGGIPDTVVSIYNGYELRNAALWQNQDASSFLNWLTSGLSGQFEVVMTTPMSDPDYWRSTKNIVGTGVTVMIAYKGYSDWISNRNPHSTEWMMQYSERMAGPAGQVPAGTFDDAFTYYEYNMVENPGPLVEIDPAAASTFASGKYNVVTLQDDVILYRAGDSTGNQLGQYFTETPPTSVAQVRVDLAIKEQWIDPSTGVLTGTSVIDSYYTIKIPKGTTIYVGPADYQGGIYLGGAEQIFIEKPWLIDGVEIISNTPLN